MHNPGLVHRNNWRNWDRDHNAGLQNSETQSAYLMDQTQYAGQSLENM